MNDQVDPKQIEEVPADDAVIGRALKGSLVVIVMIAAVGVGVFFLLRKPPETIALKETTLELPQVRDASVVEAPETPFVDVTKEAGIDFVHVNGAYGDKLLPETMGGGVAFFDYDNDADQDLLLVNSDYWPGKRPADAKPPRTRLYANDGAGKFTDVTDQTGVGVTCYGMGVAVGDYDNDGWVDVFLTTIGSNILLRNDKGRFVDVTSRMNVAGDADRWSTSAGFFDADNDGDLDLFVCNYLKWSQEFDLGQEFTLTGDERAYGSPKAFGGTHSYLYRNEGDRFADVSASVGIQILSTLGQPMGKSLGLSPVDLNRDGWMDLVVANDTVKNFVFINRKDGSFEEVGEYCGIAFDSAGQARGAMGIDVARFRNDDSLGVAIGNFATEMSALYVAEGKSSLQFNDDAVATGLGPPTRALLTFGMFFFDYDLDGRLDLFAANGHLENEIHKVQATQRYRQPPQLFYNCGPEQRTEFLPVAADKCGKDLVEPMVGRGAAYADIDNDGDLDIVLTQVDGPPRLLRNDQKLSRHWLRLKLVGHVANRDAVGAWISLDDGETVQHRPVMPTRSYISQCELPVTFGLGDADAVQSLTITWPGGQTQTLERVALDETTTVEQVAR